MPGLARVSEALPWHWLNLTPAPIYTAALIVIDHCQLFDYIEVFRNQWRRQSTLGQISPAAFERRAMTQVA